MDSKPQFDTLLGGQTDAPIEVDTMKFASARAQEIAAISEAIGDDSSKGQLIFQRLPRHMRRRVMGHNAKRMPRNLRDAYTQQLLKSSGGLVQKHKRPSRKHRRRPANLLEEYNRRQRKFTWLETHIWHAKRFHMTERWGYRLALFPNDRSHRACYRATAYHCLMQDVSFLGCIELQGSLQTLLSGLSKHTNPSCGLTFGAQSLIDGTREGEVMFYERDEYPWKLVGKVSFFWMPSRTSSNSELRRLWIWAHPAFYQKIVDDLIITFQLTFVSGQELEVDKKDTGKRHIDYTTTSTKKKLKDEDGKSSDIEQQKLATRDVPFERTQKYASLRGDVKLVALKDTLNRFRLTGPLSQAVLMEALQVVDDDEIKFSAADTAKGHQKSQEHQTCEEEDKVTLPMIDFDNDGRKSHQEFWLSTKEVDSPAELPPRIILALVVKDPRLHIPDKRTKASSTTIGRTESNSTNILPLPYSNPLWSSSVRDIVTTSKLSTTELNVLRSKLLVPGLLRTYGSNGEVGSKAPNSDIEFSVKSKIPVILVQRPGSQDPMSKRLGFGCGWDIILPAGWAMPFWLAFIFRCARPSGLREANSHELERGNPNFLPPDSVAGAQEELSRGKDLRETYFRLPPDKRPNFIKLGIACPFRCEWSKLVRDWTYELENYPDNTELQGSSVKATPPIFVIRDIHILQRINKVVQTVWSSLKSSPGGTQTAEAIMSQWPSYPNQNFSLLPVRLDALQKGLTDDMSLICIPSPEDITGIADLMKGAGPVEPPSIDNNHNERQKIRAEHKKLLLRLRRKRVCAKRKEDEAISEHDNTVESIAGPNCSHTDISPTQDLVTAFNKKMEELWLINTEEIGSVKNSCSRQTAGFITRGDYSFTEARGCGVGYISFLSLKALMEAWLKHASRERQVSLKSPSVLVLVRSPKSFQFRLATMSLIF